MDCGMSLTAGMAFELLEGAHRRERLAHAFLISGPTGSGKRELAARIIAMLAPADEPGLFADSDESPAPAGLDELEGEFVRIVRPRSKSRRITIKEIRALERSIHLAAPDNVWKVGIIVDADRMFDEPANAFLKTLEEPPPGCLLLLLTANADVLLPTIRSRCVEIVLRSTGRYEVMEKEEVEAFSSVLARCSARRDVRGALLLKTTFESLLAGRKEEIERANKEALKEEADAYKKATEGDWLVEREKFYEAVSASEYLAIRAALLDWLIAWLGDAVRQKIGVTELDFPEHAKETCLFAESQELHALLGKIDALQELRDLLNTNVSEGLALEVSFLKAFGI